MLNLVPRVRRTEIRVSIRRKYEATPPSTSSMTIELCWAAQARLLLMFARDGFRADVRGRAVDEGVLLRTSEDLFAW